MTSTKAADDELTEMKRRADELRREAATQAAENQRERMRMRMMNLAMIRRNEQEMEQLQEDLTAQSQQNLEEVSRQLEERNRAVKINI